MADPVVVSRNSMKATNETSLEYWGCSVAVKGFVLEPHAMPPVQPPMQPVGLPSPWCGKPCLTRSLFWNVSSASSQTIRGTSGT